MDLVIINGVKYIKEKSQEEKRFVIVRTYTAGVFAGYLESREGKEAKLSEAIRIWYWDGAASLSQLAMEGTNKPENCKFAIPVDSVELTEVIELLDVTENAKKNIIGVPSWKA